MTRVSSSTNLWRSSAISPAIEAGEPLRISVYTEYKSEINTLGEKDLLGVAREQSVWVSGSGTKKGSVWINEFTGNEVELCGTTNRVMFSGWTLELANSDTNYYAILSGAFDFTTNMINGTVGFETRKIEWYDASGTVIEEVPFGTYAVRLRNSVGIVEHEPSITFPIEKPVGMIGYAPWNGADYDWSGTATGNVFTWGELAANSLGEVNYPEQGFKIPVEATLKVKTGTLNDEGCTNLSFVTVVGTVYGFDNDTSATAAKSISAQSENGIATIGFKGYSASPERISVDISANAFGWMSESDSLSLTNGLTTITSLRLSPAIATDDFEDIKLKPYWKNVEVLQWDVTQESGNGILLLNTYSAKSEHALLKCENFLSAHGRKYCSVSFDFKNFKSTSSKTDYFRVEIATNSTWEGTTVATAFLANKRKDAVVNSTTWYCYQAVFEMPEGYAQADEIWVRLRCVSDGATAASTRVDNLRIAFQDVAMPTNLVRAVDEVVSGQSSDFSLDVVPQATEAVSNVTAKLCLTLNGVATNVPFAFDGATVTNLDGAATAVVSADALKKVMGDLTGLPERPFLTGDQVSYYAAVNYYSDNGDTNELARWENRYFPDNHKTEMVGDVEHWVVEGTGTNPYKPVATNFTVTGPVLSVVEGTRKVMGNGVSFLVHGYTNANNIASITVSVKVGDEYKDCPLYDDGATNRVTKVFDSANFPQLAELKGNTTYSFKVTAKDADDNVLAETAEDHFTTLPSIDFVTITGVATNKVELSVTGNLTSYEVSGTLPGWENVGGNTWKGGKSPNSEFVATVTPKNAEGASGSSVTTNGYTLAAAATRAPAITKDTTNACVVVEADGAQDDGNPVGTMYAVRIKTSKDGNDLAKTNGVEVWKTLGDWKNFPETLDELPLDPSATNTFSFVTRNDDPVSPQLTESSATTNCWFDMAARFLTVEQKQKGMVDISVELFEPAKSQNATAKVSYSLNGQDWTVIDTKNDIDFTSITYTYDISWDASAVGTADAETTYSLRVELSNEAGDRRAVQQKGELVLDFKKPTVTLSSGSLTPFNAGSWVVTNTFSEAVVGFTADSVKVVNGAVTAVTTNSLSQYVVEITPDATEAKKHQEGIEVSVKIEAGVVADKFGNANKESSNELKRTYDVVSPTVTLSSAAPTYVKDASFAVTATFCEPVVGFAADKVTVVNGTVSVSGAGPVYTLTVTPTTDGEVSVQIAANKVSDPAGNGNMASGRLSRIYDTTPPEVATFASQTPLFFNQDKMVVAVAFSENVTNFTAACVTVGNGTVTSVLAGDEKGAAVTSATVTNEYTLVITPAGQDAVTTQIAAGKVADLAGNVNTKATEVLSRTYDTVPPTVTLTSDTPAFFNKDVTFTVTATFSEPVTNASKTTFTVSNGTVASVTPVTGSDTAYTVVITPTPDQEKDVTVVTVQVEAGKADDRAGNKNVEASNVITCTCDVKPPEVVEIAGPEFFRTPSFAATVTFSENVTNVTTAAFTIGNGTATKVFVGAEQTVEAAATTATNVFTVLIAPKAEGAVTVEVEAGKVFDLAANPNVASKQAAFTYDCTAPTVALTSAVPGFFNEAPLTVTATFSEPVTNVTKETFTVGNGTVMSVEAAGGNAYTVTVTPDETAAAKAQAGIAVTVQVAAGKVADAAGNGNVASAVLSRTYDVLPPSVELTSETPQIFNQYKVPFVVTATFDENVTNVTMASFSVDNGTVTNVMVGTAREFEVTSATVTNVYTVFIDPREQEDSEAYVPVTVKVLAGAVADPAGNATGADSTALVRKNVTKNPRATLESLIPAVFNDAKKPFVVTATFVRGKNADPAFVTNFTAASVSVVNGTVTDVKPLYDPPVSPEVATNIYTITIAPTVEGEISVKIPAGVVVDVAGNENEESGELKRTYDNTPPTVPVLSGIPVSTDLAHLVATNGTAFELTATATDAISSVTKYHWTLNDAPWDQTLATYSGMVAEGTNTVVVFAEDAAGNCGAAVTNRWVVDMTKPDWAKDPITGTPEKDKATRLDDGYDLTAHATDTWTAMTYHWTLRGSDGDVASPTEGARFTGTVTEDGAYVASVYVTDEAGNVSTTNTWGWIRDTEEPKSLTITGSLVSKDPANPVITSETSFTFGSEATDLTDIEYYWVTNGVAIAVAADEVAGTAVEGTNMVIVVAKDEAGNVCAPVTNIWIVDTTAPSVSKIEGMPWQNCETNKASYALSASSIDMTATTNHWALVKDDKVVAEREETSGNGVSCDFTGDVKDGEGVYTAKFWAVDAAGNVSVTNTWSWTYDVTPPGEPVFDTAQCTPANASLTSVSNYSLTATSVGGSTYHWTLFASDGTVVSNAVCDVFKGYVPGEGIYTATVYSVDAAGNVSTVTNAWTWLYDFTPPAVSAITGLPWNGCETNETPYALSASSRDTATTTNHWALVKDGNVVAEREEVSGHDVPCLFEGDVKDEGVYTAKFWAVDIAGNSSVTNEWSWTYDVTAPVLDKAFGGSPTDGSATNVPNYNLTMGVDKADGVTYHWTLRGSDGDVASPTAGQTFEGTVPAEGVYTAMVYAVDRAGNVSTTNSMSWTYDATKPAWEDPAITGTPWNGCETNLSSFALAAHATDKLTAVTYHWALRGSDGDVASPTVGAQFSGTVEVEGVYTAMVYAVDAAGNVSTTNSWSWTYDKTAPVLDDEFGGSPTDGSATNVPNYSLTMGVDKADGVTYHWTLRGSDGDVASPTAGPQFSGTVPAEGVYTAMVYAVDRAGNVSATNTMSWTYDTTKPQKPVFIDALCTPAMNSETNVTSYAFAINEITTDLTTVTYHWQLVKDGALSGKEVAAIAPEGLAFVGDVTAEAEVNRAYTTRVWAVDAAGNVSETNSWSWTYDAVKPVLDKEFGGTPTDGAATNVPNFALSMGSTKDVTYYWTLRGSDGDVASPTAGATFEGTVEADGVYTAMVYTVDRAGNHSATNTMSWTYDAVAPTVTLTCATQDPVDGEFFEYGGRIEVVATFSEPVANFTKECVTVLNGRVAGDVQKTSDTTYKIRVQPESQSAFGPINISIAADVVKDLAGNCNEASDVVSRLYVSFITDVEGDLPQLALSGTPANGSTTSVQEFNLNTDTTMVEIEGDDVDIGRYYWCVNGVWQQTTTATISGMATNGGNTVLAYGIGTGDYDGGIVAKSAVWTWTYTPEPPAPGPDPVDFGGGVYVPVSEQYETGTVSFVSLDFKPGAASTLVMEGFEMESEQTTGKETVTGLKLRFKVSVTLGEAPTNEAVDSAGEYDHDTGYLTVTLPAAATQGKASFFILGVEPSPAPM